MKIALIVSLFAVALAGCNATLGDVDPFPDPGAPFVQQPQPSSRL